MGCDGRDMSMSKGLKASLSQVSLYIKSTVHLVVSKVKTAVNSNDA